MIVTNLDNNCTTDASVTITENLNIPVAIASTNDIGCNNTNATLDATGSSSGGNFSYEWLDDTGNLIATSLITSVNTAGLYSLIVTDNSSGCTSSTAIFVNSNTNMPTAQITGTGQLTCVVNSITLDGSGSSSGANFTYQWTDANGNVLGTGTSLTVSNAGEYFLSVMDTNNGCETQTSAIVTGNNAQTIAIISGADELNCNTTSITLDLSLMHI